MTKTITMMDDAEDIRRKRKMSEEDERNDTTKLHAVKKIDWDHWFGILKGKDRGAAAMNKEIMEERTKMSKDLDKRSKRLQRQQHASSR